MMHRTALPQVQTVQRFSDTLSYRAAVMEPDLQSILVVKVDHIGDFIMALDAFICLREAFPAARIDLACAPWNVDLALSLGVFDRVFPIAFFSGRADGEQFAFDPAVLGALAGFRWDLAIDLRVDADTRIVLRHLQATFRVGYEAADETDILTLALPHDAGLARQGNIGLHQTLLMLRLVRSTVDLFTRSDAVRGLLLNQVAARPTIDLAAAAGRPLVVCNTASGKKAKNWPIDRFARLVEWLGLGLDVAVCLMGGPDQAGDAEQIVRLCGVAHVFSAAGMTTLPEAVGLISGAKLYIGNDSGFTHVAARLGIPTVALFSGIDPTIMWAALGPEVTILKAPVGCSPCHIRFIEQCVGGHACVLDISEASVRAAVRARLNTARVPEPC